MLTIIICYKHPILLPEQCVADAFIFMILHIYILGQNGRVETAGGVGSLAVGVNEG